MALREATAFAVGEQYARERVNGTKVEVTANDIAARRFAADEVEANGQRFLFRPRPPRPPIIVGGAPPCDRPRGTVFRQGPMPTGAHAEVLGAGSPPGSAPARGRPRSCCCSRCRSTTTALAARLGELARLGVTRRLHPWPTGMRRRSRRSPPASSPPGTLAWQGPSTGPRAPRPTPGGNRYGERRI